MENRKNNEEKYDCEGKGREEEKEREKEKRKEKQKEEKKPRQGMRRMCFACFVEKNMKSHLQKAGCNASRVMVGHMSYVLIQNVAISYVSTVNPKTFLIFHLARIRVSILPST
ncbi:unnamed protein product [Danaus chrysippus]|uniref:(African queen) hypothetical protein n=1 Tax=Danaus chrysippus TaxID=151541 RepID=A0A8J2R6R8_9NEOP|nr:unnamed protein product [Danaus chrysippus]